MTPTNITPYHTPYHRTNTLYICISYHHPTSTHSITTPYKTNTNSITATPKTHPVNTYQTNPSASISIPFHSAISIPFPPQDGRCWTWTEEGVTAGRGVEVGVGVGGWMTGQTGVTGLRDTGGGESRG